MNNGEIMLFMNPGSAICVVFDDKLTWPDITLLLIQSMHIPIFTISGMIHCSAMPINISIDIGLTALKKLFSLKNMCVLYSFFLLSRVRDDCSL